MTTWPFVVVALGAACICVTLAVGVVRLRRSRGDLPPWLAFALPLACVGCLVLYGGWLWAETRGDAGWQAGVAALVMGAGGVFTLVASAVTGHLLRQHELDRTDIARRLDARTAELRSALERVERNHDQVLALIEVAEVMPFEVDLGRACISWSSPAADLKVVGQVLVDMPVSDFLARLVVEADRAALTSHASELACGARAELLKHEFRIRGADGRVRTLRAAAHVVCDEGRPAFARGYAFDVTEVRQLEADLAQAQKLESIGRLAAGVAHEINTPVQFIGDSVAFVRESCGGLVQMLRGYQAAAAGMRADPALAAALADLERTAHDVDLDYVLEQTPAALERALEGLGRVAAIVRSLKDFAHPDAADMAPVDLNRAIESTLLVARNEYKHVADVTLDLAALPPVTCHAGEINQLVLNLVVNAAHAIEDAPRPPASRGTIRILTREAGPRVAISVEDDGCGIPPEIRGKLFDPFFTTKAVGRGTGQGLAIARRVVDRHGGTLSFESEVGKGTTFRVELPLSAPR